jgi:hypothetical protein
MTKRTEFDLHKRRIVHVVDFFDDECEYPWNYVVRAENGKFEAMTTALLSADGMDIARDHSLGLFDDVKSAVRAINEHEARLDAASASDDWLKQKPQ